MCCSAHGLGTAALARNEPEALPYCAIAYALTGIVSTVLCALPPVRNSLLMVAGAAWKIRISFRAYEPHGYQAICYKETLGGIDLLFSKTCIGLGLISYLWVLHKPIQLYMKVFLFFISCIFKEGTIQGDSVNCAQENNIPMKIYIWRCVAVF